VQSSHSPCSLIYHYLCISITLLVYTFRSSYATQLTAPIPSGQYTPSCLSNSDERRVESLRRCWVRRRQKEVNYANAGTRPPLSDGGGGGGGSWRGMCQLSQPGIGDFCFLTSNLVFSAIILWNPIPTPSMTASKQAHPIAEFLAAFNPPLTANAPPVKNPAMTLYRLVHCYARITCTKSRGLFKS
jgi:hypothetical protein